VRILFYGDIVGKVGRNAVHLSLPNLVKKYQVDFVIANGENSTHGKGLSERDYRFLVDSGVDCVTLGNHWHNREEIDEYIDDADRLVRPLNILNYHHGVGSAVFDVDGTPVRVTNALGVFAMNETVAAPVPAIEDLLKDDHEPGIHIVDYHADSTSEKAIFAYVFDGRVSAVIGTHTHVQSNDARILPNGTGYITDVGMCGDAGGIIGFEKRSVINKMVYGEKGSFGLDEHAPMMINAVLMDFDEMTYKCTAIKMINEVVSEGDN
jgi:2',3'-cyclic-nucleotide 2'-phosphodiesterase